MKKMNRLLICLILTASLILTVPTASAELPAIDSVLATGLPVDKVEVYNELDDYILLDEEFDEYDYDLRLLILQREVPEKEFTSKTVYPPFVNSDGFDEDFNGIDIGEPRIWLRSDLMRQIPEEYRAGSMKEATYLIIAETQYVWDGTISTSNFSETNDDELPEFKDTDEMYEYFLAHPRTVTSMTYYPKFGIYSVITIYEKATKRSSILGAKYTQSRRFAKNPEACDQWNNMSGISGLLDSLETGSQAELQAAWETFESYDFIPQVKKDLWKSCIDADELSTAYYSVSGYYWSMAEELKKLDPSEKNRGNYDLIIRERNRMVLSAFVNYCNYSGIERSIISIEQSGDYMAKPDYEWIEEQMQEFVDIFR